MALPIVIDTSSLENVRAGLLQVKAILDTLETDINANILTVASGVYTPTLSNSTNVAASTPYQCQYLRVGSVVTVSGRVDIDPTATGNTILYMSLPIASNIGTVEDIGGCFNGTTTQTSGGIYGDTAGDLAIFRYEAVSTANIGLHFIFQYRII